MKSNTSLYHLSNQYVDLLSCLYDHETGEINQEIEVKLNEIGKSTEEKCISVASWIKKMQSDKKEVESIKQEMIAREQSYDKAISKMENYLKYNMETCGIKEINCPYFTLRVKTNPYSTEVIDEYQIPEIFMKTREIIKIEKNPDKNSIKEEFLKTGVQIPGTFVQQKTKLDILIEKI